MPKEKQATRTLNRTELDGGIIRLNRDVGQHEFLGCRTRESGP